MVFINGIPLNVAYQSTMRILWIARRFREPLSTAQMYDEDQVDGPCWSPNQQWGGRETPRLPSSIYLTDHSRSHSVDQILIPLSAAPIITGPRDSRTDAKPLVVGQFLHDAHVFRMQCKVDVKPRHRHRAHNYAIQSESAPRRHHVVQEELLLKWGWEQLYAMSPKE